MQPDERYCRRCEQMLPIAAFLNGQKRFCCKKHFYELQRLTRRAPRHRKHAEPSTPESRAIHYARKLARSTFSGYDLSLTSSDALRAIEQDLCIVPLDPTAPLSASNFAMCKIRQRQILSKLWSVQRDAVLYAQLLQSFK
jgi:hypothetical protein